METTVEEVEATGGVMEATVEEVGPQELRGDGGYC